MADLQFEALTVQVFEMLCNLQSPPIKILNDSDIHLSM